LFIKFKSFAWQRKSLKIPKKKKIKKHTQPIEWKKIFASDMTNKEFISNRYKQFIQRNIEKKID